MSNYRSTKLIAVGFLSLALSAGCGSTDPVVAPGDPTCDAAKITPGDFCGSLLSSTFAAADAASFSKATEFGTASGKTATFGVKEYRVRYKTQVDAASTVIDATGVILLPDGVAPTGGFPILMWGHGTVGMADTAAPSINPSANMEVSIRNYAARGFIVIAPDYAGLGVADVPHYYLVKKPTAYSIIDAVRSGITFAKAQGLSVSKSTVFVGHSQGGEAVLFADEIYKNESYGAADFDLKGVVALAPAPIWKYALWAAVAYNQSLGSFASSYLYSASKYNTALDLTKALSAASITAITANAETKTTVEMAQAAIFPTTYATFLSSFFATSVLVDYSALTKDTVPYGYIYGVAHGEAVTTTLNKFDTVWSGSGVDSAWADEMDKDSPILGLASSTVPIRLVQGFDDATVTRTMTLLMYLKAFALGNSLEDADGAAMGASGITAEFANISPAATATCAADTKIIVCGKGHADIPFSFDKYASWVFAKAGL